ncbi:unnamed protein product [Urochloa humidicola]
MAGAQGESSGERQGAAERRMLRSRYLAVKNLINDERDEMAKADSDKFTAIISQVESLHELGKDCIAVACERTAFPF